MLHLTVYFGDCSQCKTRQRSSSLELVGEITITSYHASTEAASLAACDTTNQLQISGARIQASTWPQPHRIYRTTANSSGTWDVDTFGQRTYTLCLKKRH